VNWVKDCSEQGPMVGFCSNADESSGFICGELLNTVMSTNCSVYTLCQVVVQIKTSMSAGKPLILPE
jgi:hypothetical protein